MKSLLKSAIRSIARSPMRVVLILIILTVSISLSLIMLNVSASYSAQLNSLSSMVGNTIDVRPAGFFGGMGGGEPLDESKVDEIAKLDHVVSITKTIQTRYTGTSIASSIQPGTLGNQFSNNGTNLPNTNRSFRVGIQVIGMSATLKNITLQGGVEAPIIEGRGFNSADEGKDVMIIGKDLASYNNLKIGDKVDLNGTNLEIIGIFDSGQRFGNNSIILPLKTAQNLFNIKGITDVTVYVDDANNENLVVSEIRKIFNENTADITTSVEQYQRISTPLQNAIKTSNLALIISLIASGIVILLSVMLTIRQRIKEIGVLKAIGASNLRIGLQFVVETIFISLIASILGVAITFPFAQTIGNLLVQTAGISGRNFGFAFTRFRNVVISVAPSTILYAILIGIGLALLGSLIPLFYINNVKPAEVLRYE